jgi:ubiquinone/menaquinone biosynthesis C-methylase UbiE
MSLEEHQRELQIALDPANPARAMPPILPNKHKRILDVGCGMGQTLIAAKLPDGVEAYGVDCDKEAVDAGRHLAPPNIKLQCGSGENLPFENEYFDLVFSRVALPYMNINKALREMARVLKPGGDLWLTLHPASMFFSRVKHSARAGNLKDLVFCGFVLLNGSLFNTVGSQFSFRGRQETFQTAGGIARAMKRAGFSSFPVRSDAHFTVQGQKIAS